ncbi:MAG: hypothetical protein ACTHJ8_07710, partial [Mucilaginibacter sp.]
MKKSITLLLLCFAANDIFAQSGDSSKGILTNPGVLITILLIVIPILAVVYLVTVKVNRMIKDIRDAKIKRDARQLATSLKEISVEDLDEELVKRKQALIFKRTGTELRGEYPVVERQGLLLSGLEVVSRR